MKIKARGKAGPEALCRAALLLKGVPKEIVNGLSAGPVLDLWVELCVMRDKPWREAKNIISESLI